MTISRKELEAGGVNLSEVIEPSISPMDQTPPGVLLREEWLEPLGLTAYRLARDIGAPPDRVTAILSGERAITADMALRLARYFGTDAQSWLNLQVRHDLAVELRDHGDEIAKSVHPRAGA
jgi:addiction module HigA family antidote